MIIGTHLTKFARINLIFLIKGVHLDVFILYSVYGMDFYLDYNLT